MTKYDLVITNGTIVTARDIFQADLAITGSKITAIGNNLSSSGERSIDAAGMYLLPGGIDVHTHLDMPTGGIVTSDDFYSGTVAAAFGGTTTIIDFANQRKGESLTRTAEAWQERARGKAVIDYSFHITVADFNDRVEAEIPLMISKGYTSFKLFTTYEGLRVSDEVFLKMLALTREHGGLVCTHAENYYMIDYLAKGFLKEGKREPIFHALSRPPVAEAEATSRVIKLAQVVGAPIYIVHLSCREALAEVNRAREQGLPVMAETCPQYLLLSQELYEHPEGAKYVMSPPLRQSENQPVLWEALNRGSLQVVATDHCPFNYRGQKDVADSFDKIPNGNPGIETRMSLLYGFGVNQGNLGLSKVAAITATNPAKIFGLYPQKGTLAVGSDADIVIYDPNQERTLSIGMLHENVDYTPYEGMKVKGYPLMTLSRGEVIVDKGQFQGCAGRGHFIPRKGPEII